ncbi:MAG: sigma-70 family RNA polymerase sigma factor, partial [Pirellulales bacterium]
MEQVQAGQSGQFDELILRHRPGLLRFAQSVQADADLAEDAAQEALLAAFAARSTYNPRFAFSTWVYTILLNVCRRQRRRQLRAVVTGREFGLCSRTDDSPLDRLMQSETREQLAQLLIELPDAEADALRLRFFAGLQFDQIALAMESSVSGAKVRVRRGLARLADRLRGLQDPAADAAITLST